MSIAQSLGGAGGQGSGQERQETPAPEKPEAAADPSPTEEEGAAPGLDLDPRLMEAGMRALSVWRDPNDPRAALLRALRPFLAPERQGKLDRAIRVVRLSRTIRAALEGIGGGGKADV